MTDPKTTSPPVPSAAKPTSTAALKAAEEKPAARGVFDREAQQKEIREANEAEAEKQRKIRQDMRDDKTTSLEGARPEFEPEPGYAAAMPSPGSVPGGPVPEADEFREYTTEEASFWQNRQKDGSKVDITK